MNDLIRVHCRHCEQTYFTRTAGLQECELCRKVAGVVTPEAAIDSKIQQAFQNADHGQLSEEWARRCARCESVMVLARADQWYLNGAIPCGKTLHFCCIGCGKEIDIDGGPFTLMMLLGFLATATLTVWSFLRPELGWQVAIAIAAFSLLAGFWLLHQMFARIRYPRQVRYRASSAPPNSPSLREQKDEESSKP